MRTVIRPRVLGVIRNYPSSLVERPRVTAQPSPSQVVLADAVQRVDGSWWRVVRSGTHFP